MKVTIAKGIPRLNGTPLAEVSLRDSQIVVELDDEHGNRFKLVFSPYQAMRATTADCYAVPDGTTLLPQTTMEVHDSEWIRQLKANLNNADESATFLNPSRHLILPLQDDFLEIVATNVVVSGNEGPQEA